MCGPSEKEQQDSPRQDSAYHHQIHPRFRISVLVDPVESSHPIHDQRRKYSPTGIAVKPIIISSLQERLATFQNECSRNKTNDNISNRTFGQGPQNGHFDKIEIQDNRIYQQGRRKDVIQQYIEQFVHAFLLLFLPVKQKDNARDARAEGSSWDGNEKFEFENAEPTVFVGYDTLETDAKVVGIVVEDEGICDTIIENQKGFIVTDKTPFYAEMGGQVGDIGTITINGKAANVVNTTKTEDGYYLHETEVQLTPIKVGDTVTMSVDKVHRTDVCRNHTATHILDKALRDVLGSHVAQAGSLVESDRLRFDFSHFEAMTTEQIKQAEAIVNEKILESIDVTVQELPIEEAKKLGAIALFGEKYGDVVRVVSVGDYSVEFCGGTHLTNTAQCGLFKIISESGVAAGVRRIEAVTGKGVLEYINNSDRLIEKTAAALKINQINEIDHKAESVMAQCRELEKAVDSFKEKMAAAKANNIMTGIKHIGEISLITAQVDGMGADEMKSMADKIKAEVPNSVAVMGAETDGKITFVAMASKEAVKLGVHCGKIIKDITAVAGGRGGGKPDMAQGGGSDASKIDDALAKVDEIVAEQIK